jgi:hypothetical protein
MQDTINRTYLMSLSYINPGSHWVAGLGRLYLPWASSLETIDGGYVGRQFAAKTVAGVFAGSTPDPFSWTYNPNGKIGGVFFNMHGGSFENLHYSSTTGVGYSSAVYRNTTDQTVSGQPAVQSNFTSNRPFLFTENDFTYKRYLSLFHSMQIDRPTPNPGTPALNWGLGQSLLTVRVQVHPRVTLDVSDTYFRQVPAYDPTLLAACLSTPSSCPLDKYLFQGINGGARIQFPEHITGYFSLGRSSNASDPKSSLNTLYGVTMSNIWKTGLVADVRYSKFDSAFATGTYRSVSLTRDLGERLRMSLQGGSYGYNSTYAANSNSYFVNTMFDTNLGSRYFLQSAFTAQRGGTMEYNQWTTTLGYRFDNRAKARRVAHANQP